MKAFGRIYTGHEHVLLAEALQELEPIFLMFTSGLKKMPHVISWSLDAD